jgi:hypothetical protein
MPGQQPGAGAERPAYRSSGRSAHCSCPRRPCPSVDSAPSGPGTHGRIADAAAYVGSNPTPATRGPIGTGSRQGSGAQHLSRQNRSLLHKVHRIESDDLPHMSTSKHRPPLNYLSRDRRAWSADASCKLDGSGVSDLRVGSVRPAGSLAPDANLVLNGEPAASAASSSAGRSAPVRMHTRRQAADGE